MISRKTPRALAACLAIAGTLAAVSASDVRAQEDESFEWHFMLAPGSFKSVWTNDDYHLFKRELKDRGGNYLTPDEIQTAYSEGGHRAVTEAVFRLWVVRHRNAACRVFGPVCEGN